MHTVPTAFVSCRIRHDIAEQEPLSGIPLIAADCRLLSLTAPTVASCRTRTGHNDLWQLSAAYSLYRIISLQCPNCGSQSCSTLVAEVPTLFY